VDIDWKELANRSSDVISRIDKNGRVTFVSESIKRVLGYEPSDLVGRDAHSFLSPDDQPQRLAAFERGVRDGVAPTVVARARKKDGTYVWMEYRNEVLRDAAGNVEGFQSSSHDVTARVEAERALETLVRTMPVPAVVHHDGRLVCVNDAYTTTFGWTEAEMAGWTVLDLVDPADRAYVAGRVELGVDRVAGIPSREHYVRHKDGTSVAVEATFVPISFRGETCSLAVLRDLRERKRFEAQLITAERMASLGRLAATVGHEINNPLAYVLSSVSLIERELVNVPAEKIHTLRELVGNVDEGARRIRDVVEDLRVFSRERTGEIGSVDLARLLDRAASMASHEVRRRAKLVKAYPSARSAGSENALPAVSGNEARLGQVFLNLLVNAAQAIPDDGSASHEVRLEARAKTVDGEGFVEVDVVDTGVGIDATVAPHLFDPFFTTKMQALDGSSEQMGTGLGLSISRHIVVSLGGTLSLVSSKPGETRFRVVLRAGSL
jgi:PAS domain S-box-containing protein